MPVASVNGAEIAYDDTGGDGPPVILAHRFLMDRTMFAPQVEALGGSYRVITWDERAFGDTVYDGEPFTYWDLATPPTSPTRRRPTIIDFLAGLPD